MSPPHLTVEELELRYRAASEAIERSHYQIIWRSAQGQTSRAVAEWTGYSPDRIYKLLRHYGHISPSGPKTPTDGEGARTRAAPRVALPVGKWMAWIAALETGEVAVALGSFDQVLTGALRVTAAKREIGGRC